MPITKFLANGPDGLLSAFFGRLINKLIPLFSDRFPSSVRAGGQSKPALPSQLGRPVEVREAEDTESGGELPREGAVR